MQKPRMKWARVLCCRACSYFGEPADSVWPRCKAPDGRVLDEDAMEGPNETCPLGLWDDLRPVSLKDHPHHSDLEPFNRKQAAVAVYVALRQLASKEEKCAHLDGLVGKILSSKEAEWLKDLVEQGIL
jgi:hypothetical protein